jgi:ribA/ribD-fused uncharacterized protein
MANKTKPNGIIFYRANDEYGFLSNLHPCNVVFEGKAFSSAEAAFQYGKPSDMMVAEWLVSAPKPRFCALAAHALLPYDVKPEWPSTKVTRMKYVLRAKFGQHKELRDNLLGTGKAKLIEGSPTDEFWGVGKSGEGKNLLGKLLMEIRQELREAVEEDRPAPCHVNTLIKTADPEAH